MTRILATALVGLLAVPAFAEGDAEKGEKAIENPNSLLDKKIEEFVLKYAAPEDVLSVARPLLGLEDEANTNEQINISVDPFDSRLFVTGTDEHGQKVQESQVTHCRKMIG